MEVNASKSNQEGGNYMNLWRMSVLFNLLIEWLGLIFFTMVLYFINPDKSILILAATLTVVMLIAGFIQNKQLKEEEKRN